jgi:putative Mg2+ transporter-C (MgtC) family protein
MLSHAILLGRIALGGALGGVIGYERDRHGRPVGLRTHLIVALASATFMVVSSQFAYYQGFAGHEGIEVDASRIAASVVSAIGFLAGGSILRTGATVQGLTTAAGLWLVTAIGLCAGAGMFVESVTVTFLGIVALTVFRRFEDKNDLLAKRRVLLVLAPEATAVIPGIMESIAAMGATVTEVAYDRRMGGEARTEVTLDVTLPVSIALNELVETLEQQSGVQRIQIGNAS